jgi:hypothetical protein
MDRHHGRTRHGEPLPGSPGGEDVSDTEGRVGAGSFCGAGGADCQQPGVGRVWHARASFGEGDDLAGRDRLVRPPLDGSEPGDGAAAGGAGDVGRRGKRESVRSQAFCRTASRVSSASVAQGSSSSTRMAGWPSSASGRRANRSVQLVAGAAKAAAAAGSGRREVRRSDMACSSCIVGEPFFTAVVNRYDTVCSRVGVTDSSRAARKHPIRSYGPRSASGMTATPSGRR